MYFVVTAFDSKDSESGKRRNSVREQHLENIKKLIKERKHLYGAAILNDDNNMIGSILIVDIRQKKFL